MRRILLALALVAATTVLAVPAAIGAPAVEQCATTDGVNVGVRVPVSGIPVTVSVTDTTTAVPVDVTVGFKNSGTTFELSSASSSLVLADASWCVKASAKTSPLYDTGLTGSTPATNKKGTAQRIGYVTVYSVTTTAPVATCYAPGDAYPSLVDFKLTGPINTFQNVTGYDSTDGTCSGSPYPVQETVVSAADQTEADAKCNAITSGSTGTFALSILYPDAPADYWACSRVSLTVYFTGGLQTNQAGPFVDLGTNFYDTAVTNPSALLKVCEASTSNCVQFDSTASPGSSQALTLSGASKALDVTVYSARFEYSDFRLRADVYAASPDYEAAYFFTDSLLNVEPLSFNAEETGTTTETFSNGGTVYLVTKLTWS